LGIGGCPRYVLGTAARRLRQSDQWDRGDGNALALPNPNCHTVPIANGYADRSGAKRGDDGDDPGGRLEQPYGLHLQ
jgi:hypothetical protein